MKLKFLLLLFTGFHSVYFGEIKANENFCNYKTTAEYHSCLDKSSLPPKIVFPFFIRKLWRYALFYYQDSPNFKTSIRNIYQLSSNDGDSLIIDKGRLDLFNQFRKQSSEEIPKEKILGWSVLENFKEDSYNNRKYKISYLTENFIKKEINFLLIDDNRDWWRQLQGDVISEFLSAITGLYKNEQRSKNYIDTIIRQKIDDLIKQQDVIAALIKVQNSDLKNCTELNKVKFPELTERVKNIEQKIYSLRSKLDSPHSGDLTPICDLRSTK